MRAEYGDEAQWATTDHLLALVYDQLAMANWQRSGGKKSQRPKPLPRPGVKDPGRSRLGSTPRSIPEMRVLLDRWNAGQLRDASVNPTEVR